MTLTKLIKSVIVFTSLSFVCVANATQASQLIPYYGDEFYQDLKSGSVNESLGARLKAILRSFHVRRSEGADLLVTSCQEPRAQGQGTCYAHTSIGYDAARVFLMGNYYLVEDESGYGVRDVYCDRERGGKEFRRSQPAPGAIPDNRVVNVEHTWPQSQFTRKYSSEMQKSDLHHLFPTDSKINAIRGNNMFGEVTVDLFPLKCPASRFGIGSAGTEEVFEPPQQHRGNVARALFYFSIRYDLPIDQREETILRKWHVEDPVDAEEVDRNSEIYKVQGNRNPFIDFPDLVDRLTDF